MSVCYAFVGVIYFVESENGGHCCVQWALSHTLSLAHHHHHHHHRAHILTNFMSFVFLLSLCPSPPLIHQCYWTFSMLDKTPPTMWWALAPRMCTYLVGPLVVIGQTSRDKDDCILYRHIDTLVSFSFCILCLVRTLAHFMSTLQFGLRSA